MLSNLLFANKKPQDAAEAFDQMLSFMQNQKHTGTTHDHAEADPISRSCCSSIKFFAPDTRMVITARISPITMQQHIRKTK